MAIHGFVKTNIIAITLVSALAFIIACGTAAPEPPAAEKQAPEPVVQEKAPQEASESMVQKEAAVAPESMSAPPEVMRPEGTINVGQKELGIFGGHPTLAVNPGLFVIQTAPIPEGLLFTDINKEIKGWLAESWSISPDFTTWTFKLR